VTRHAGDESNEPHGGDWEYHCRALTDRPIDRGVTHALVVSHRDEIVHEWYGHGRDVNSTLLSWSIAKSITHALVGIAVDDGAMSLQQKNLRPEWLNDERSNISLDDLLTMRSGLAWIEDYVDDQQSDVITMLYGESEYAGDHAGFAAAKSLVHPPGQEWLYSSGTTNIVAQSLGASIDVPIADFIQHRLFDPLGMSSATAKYDSVGTFVGSSYVYATARDSVRFGSLYLHGGVVDHTPLLSQSWVQSAGEHVAYDPEMSLSYGRHWWMWPTHARSLIAHGYKGQILWVCPQRELIVAHFGDTDAAYGGELRSMVAHLVEAFPVSGAAMRHDGEDG